MSTLPWLPVVRPFAVAAVLAVLFAAAELASAAILEAWVAPLTIAVGQSAVVTFTLNAQDQPINTIAGVVRFPASVAISTVADGNSVVNFWVQPPTADAGAVRFSGVIPGGYAGRGGHLFTVTVTAADPGVAVIAASELQAFLNDGQGTAAFETTVFFGGHLLVGVDTAGTAVLPAHTTSTAVVFKTPYPSPPKVTATVRGAPEVFYGTDAVTPEGFRLVVAQAVPQPLTFDWIALAVNVANAPPLIREVRINPPSGAAGAPIELWVLADDPDGDALTYRWSDDAGGRFAGDTGLVWYTLAQAFAVTDVGITVRISDGHSEVDHRLTVRQFPTAGAGQPPPAAVVDVSAGSPATPTESSTPALLAPPPTPSLAPPEALDAPPTIEAAGLPAVEALPPAEPTPVDASSADEEAAPPSADTPPPVAAPET